MASRGLTAPESLPNLAGGTGASPVAAVVASGRSWRSRVRGAGLGMRDVPAPSPPGGLEGRALVADHQVATVLARAATERHGVREGRPPRPGSGRDVRRSSTRSSAPAIVSE